MKRVNDVPTYNTPTKSLFNPIWQFAEVKGVNDRTVGSVWLECSSIINLDQFSINKQQQLHHKCQQTATELYQQRWSWIPAAQIVMATDILAAQQQELSVVWYCNNLELINGNVVEIAMITICMLHQFHTKQPQSTWAYFGVFLFLRIRWSILEKYFIPAVETVLKHSVLTWDLFVKKKVTATLRDVWHYGNMYLNYAGSNKHFMPWNDFQHAAAILRTANAETKTFGLAKKWFEKGKHFSVPENFDKLLQHLSNNPQIRSEYGKILSSIYDVTTGNWSTKKSAETLHSMDSWPAEDRKNPEIIIGENKSNDEFKRDEIVKFIKTTKIFKESNKRIQLKIVEFIKTSIPKNSPLLSIDFSIPKWVINTQYSNCISMDSLNDLLLTFIEQEKYLVYLLLIVGIRHQYVIPKKREMVCVIMGLSPESFWKQGPTFVVLGLGALKNYYYFGHALFHQFSMLLMHNSSKNDCIKADLHRICVTLFRNWRLMYVFGLELALFGIYSLLTYLYSSDGPYGALTNDGSMRIDEQMGIYFVNQNDYASFIQVYSKWYFSDNHSKIIDLTTADWNPLYSKNCNFRRTVETAQVVRQPPTNTIENKQDNDTDNDNDNDNDNKNDNENYDLQLLFKQIQRNKNYGTNKGIGSVAASSVAKSFTVYGGDQWDTMSVSSVLTTQSTMTITKPITFVSDSKYQTPFLKSTINNKPRIKNKPGNKKNIESKQNIENKQNIERKESKESSCDDKILYPTMDIDGVHKQQAKNQQYKNFDPKKPPYWAQEPHFNVNWWCALKMGPLLYCEQMTDTQIDHKFNTPSGNRNFQRIYDWETSNRESTIWRWRLGTYNSYDEGITAWANLTNTFMIVEEGILKQYDVCFLDLIATTRKNVNNFSYDSFPEMEHIPWSWRNRIATETFWLDKIDLASIDSFIRDNKIELKDCAEILTSQSVYVRKIACEFAYVDYLQFDLNNWIDISKKYELLWNKQSDQSKSRPLKLNSWKISKHCDLLQPESLSIASIIEITLFDTNTVTNHCVVSFIQALKDILDLWKEYIINCGGKSKEHKRTLTAAFRLSVSNPIIDLKRHRSRNAIFINIGAWLNKFVPKSNDLLWFATKVQIKRNTKKMLFGMDTVAFKNGYPVCNGFNRFLKVYGFAPVVQNNSYNKIVLPMEFQRLMKTINKINLMVVDAPKTFTQCHIQWSSQIAKWIEILNQGNQAMINHQRLIQSNV